MRPLKSIVLFACLCALLSCGRIQAYAQSQSLGLAPAFIDATVQRGKTYIQDFTIANNTRTRLRFHCYVGDYWYDDHNARLLGRPGTLPRSASSWVQFTPDEIIVEPQSSAVVKVVIAVPQAAAGGYYTMPFFEGEPADKPAEQSKASSSVAVRLGGLLMLATSDASEYNLEVMGGSIVPPTASSELEMNLDLRNRGTAHARVRGMFAILDASGKVAGRGRIEEKSYLPGQRNMLQAPWSGELQPGHYTAVITLTYDRAGMEPATLLYETPFDVPK